MYCFLIKKHFNFQNNITLNSYRTQKHIEKESERWRISTGSCVWSECHPGFAVTPRPQTALPNYRKENKNKYIQMDKIQQRHNAHLAKLL